MILIFALVLLCAFFYAKALFDGFIAQKKYRLEKIPPMLEYYFDLKRDYKIFVSQKGMDNWQQIRHMEEIKMARVKNACVCYPSGEIIQIFSIVKEIPSGTHWIEENEGLGFEEIALGEVDFSQTEIEIENEPSKNPSGVNYETIVTNKTAGNLYPIAFGGYQKDEENGAFVLNNVIGSAYSPRQFKNWYGLKNEFLSPGETVCDPNNYGDGDGYWIFVFKSESGEIKKAGCILGK